MEKIITKLFTLIEDLPVWGQILSLFLIAVFIYVGRIMLSKRVQNSLINRTSKILTRVTKNDLIRNDLFAKEDYYLNIIKNLSFPDKYKEKIFKILLTEKLKGDIAILKNFVNTTDLSKFDVNDLCCEIHKLTSKMILNYETSTFEKLSAEFGHDKALKLFDLIMENDNGFRATRKERINRIFDFINDKIRLSKIFDNNIERMDSFLYEIEYSIRLAILNTESNFRNLNGEIKKIIETK